MNKVLIGIVAAVCLLAGAVLIVPGLIDWNEYKDTIAEQAKAYTGRDLKIGGDIRIAILPAPALVVSDVSLQSLPGAAEPSMVRLKSLEVRLALGPLLGGDIQVDSVRLIEPVVNLEVMADGRRNWELAPAATPGAGRPGGSAADQGDRDGETSLPDVRLDSFVIERGVVVYRDARSGSLQRVDDIQAKVAAGSLRGPFESAGRFVFRGLPLTYEASFGKIIEERTLPFGLTVGSTAGALKAQLNGTALGIGHEPRLKGKLKVEAKDLAAVLASLGAGGALPGVLGQAFSLNGDVLASAHGAETKDLTLRLGDLQSTGTVHLDLSNGPSAVGKFTVPRVDLDALLAMAPVTPKAEPRAEAPSPGTIALAPRPPAPTPAPPAAGFDLPDEVNAAIGLTIDTVTFKGGIIRDVRANAELAAGAVTVSQLSAQFPGSSDMFLSGFVTAERGAPRFDGQIEATVNDIRSVLHWLGTAPPADLPNDRLRKAVFRSGLQVTAEQAQLPGVDLTIDSSHVTGGLTVALRERIAFGADLNVDRINLDGYRKAGDAGQRKPGPEPAGDAKPASAAATAGEAFTFGKTLSSFDANIKLQVGEITYNRTPIKTVVLDGTLYGGALQLRRLSVADLAGVSASLGGGVKGLSGIPSFDKLTVSAKAADLSRLFRLLGTAPPVSPAGLGAVAIDGTLDGGLLGPAIEVSGTAAGAKLAAKGKISVLSLQPGADLAVRVDTADLAKLLAALGVSYRPAGRIAVQVAGNLKTDLAQATVSGITGAIGGTSVEGGLKAAFRGEKPKIEADLSLGELKIDDFLPAQRAAALETSPAGPGGVLPASWLAPARARAQASLLTPIAVDQRWSRQPLDLSGLDNVDADIKAKAAAVIYDAYRLQGADLVATIRDGVLKTERLTGTLFGGALNADVEIKAKPLAAVQSKLTVAGLDVGQATRALSGTSGSGRMDLSADLHGSGKSTADLVSTLAGDGSLAMRGLDVQGGGKGSALAGVLGVVGGLNQLGGRKDGGLADVAGTFRLDKGIARSDDLKLTSGLGDGSIKGTVDLPQWQIDAAGEIVLTQNLATALLGQKIKLPERVPLKVKGKLDAPTVTFDTAAPAPAAPGSEKAQPKPEQPAAKPKAEDVIRDILKGLR